MFGRVLQKHLRSYKHALAGIFVIIRELNFWVELGIGGVLLISGLYFKFRWYEYAILYTIWGILLAFEVMNTAIEALSDRISREHDIKIKNAKDLGALAVLIIAVILLLIYLIVIWQYV